MTRTRLDALLAARGLFPSRAQAAAAVMAGEVQLSSDGRRLVKPGQLVDTGADLLVAERARYVSRGGLKLEHALAASGVTVAGLKCLDVGASTGGFTDCLLQAGAGQVTCVDVGYGELAWKLRQDARVSVLERTNARNLQPQALPYAAQLIVADVSFISLRLVLPSVLRCGAPGFTALALVKPQFELGRGRVGKGGVVRDAGDRRSALISVGRLVREELSLGVRGFIASGLPGPKGNRESFIHIVPAGQDSEEPLENLVLAAEPIP